MAGLLIHEWIEESGGSERVFDEFVRTFPDGDIRVLWNDAPDRFPGRTVVESALARTPLRRHKALALPLMAVAWRRLATHAAYDWMLVSSHLFAHHARLRGRGRDIPKYVYTHTPARYIWVPELDRRGDSAAIRAASAVLRPLDRHRAAEAHAIAANSQYVRKRVQDTWERDAAVIYPPVDVDRIISGGDWRNALSAQEQETLDTLPPDFILGASRFVSYKRLDLVIEAGEAIDAPVVLAGSGPESSALRGRAAVASVPVHFVPSPSNAMLYSLYRIARAFVFPPVEDFGIMPVEAMAAGTPVIVNATGGAGESIRACNGGVAIEDFSEERWRAAFDAVGAIDRTALPERTRIFSAERFREELRGWCSPEGA